MRRRSAPVNVGFLVLWMVFWTAAILVAIWHMGGAAWHGEVAPALFLVVWVVAAGFGLLSAARQLVRLLLEGRSPPKPVRNHEWDDGFVTPPSSADRPEAARDAAGGR